MGANQSRYSSATKALACRKKWSAALTHVSAFPRPAASNRSTQRPRQPFSFTRPHGSAPDKRRTAIYESSAPDRREDLPHVRREHGDGLPFAPPRASSTEIRRPS